MTFARFATVAVPLPPRAPGPPPSAGRTTATPADRLGAVTGRDTALLPVYPAGHLPPASAGRLPLASGGHLPLASGGHLPLASAGHRAGDRETALLPVCGDDAGEAGR